MQLDPASGWCHGVQVCPSPNFNERPADHSLLVIHNISLPPAQFATGKVREFFRIVWMSPNIPILQASPTCASRIFWSNVTAR